MQSLGVRTIFDYRSTDLSKISKRFDVAYDTAAVMTPRMGTGLLNKGGVYLDINPTPARFIRSPFDRRLKPIVAQHQHRLRHRVAGALAAGSRWPLHFRPHPGNQRQRARAARVCPRRRVPHLGQPFERRWADLDGLGDEGLGRVSLKRFDEEGSMRSLGVGRVQMALARAACGVGAAMLGRSQATSPARGHDPADAATLCLRRPGQRN